MSKVHYNQIKFGHSCSLKAMAEGAVGCEACHGPLGPHNDWQKQFGKSGQKDPTLPKWSPAQVVDNCGFCHARRGDLTGDFRPGDDFLDHLRLEIPHDSETFYADGQVREEDYEYARLFSGAGCIGAAFAARTATIRIRPKRSCLAIGSV
jgi:hypothetical protein